ncbi:hypothetical protein ACFQJ8_20200 [Halocatena marina]|uniref:hypothetical protein n=1 Tax=Halocatena marina TaxID=2934937 RepID=UPI003613E6B6
MSIQRDFRHGIRIARAELVRELRVYTGNTRRAIGFGAILVAHGMGLVTAVVGAHVLGQAWSFSAVDPYVGPIATVLPIILFVGMIRRAGRLRTIEAEELMLMIVHPRAIVIGLVGSDIIQLVLWFGVPLGIVVTVLGIGEGILWLPLTFGLVVLPLLCWVGVWGYACGIWLSRLARRFSDPDRLGRIVWLIVLIGIVGGSQIVIIGTDGVLSTDLSALTLYPLRAYGALTFAGTPLAESLPVGGLVVLSTLVVLVPVGLALATRQATALWFTEATHRSRVPRGASSGFTVPRPFSRTLAGRMAWGHLLRGKRRSSELVRILIVPVVLLVISLPAIYTAGEHREILLAGIGVVIGAVLSGFSFGLNPLGDDRPWYPLLLLTEASSHTLVQSRVIAGLAVGLPVAVLVPFASVAIGTTPLIGLVFAGVGTGSCVGGALVAVGIGSAFPNYDRRPYWGDETALPSKTARQVFLFFVAGNTVGCLVAVWTLLHAQPLTAFLIGLGGVYLQ